MKISNCNFKIIFGHKVYRIVQQIKKNVLFYIIFVILIIFICSCSKKGIIKGNEQNNNEIKSSPKQKLINDKHEEKIAIETNVVFSINWGSGQKQINLAVLIETNYNGVVVTNRYGPDLFFIDKKGNYYISYFDNIGNKFINKFDKTGKLLKSIKYSKAKTIPNSENNFVAFFIFVDNNENIYLYENLSVLPKLRIFDKNGKYIDEYRDDYYSKKSKKGIFKNNKGDKIIAKNLDYYNNRLKEVIFQILFL